MNNESFNYTHTYKEFLEYMEEFFDKDSEVINNFKSKYKEGDIIIAQHIWTDEMRRESLRVLFKNLPELLALKN